MLVLYRNRNTNAETKKLYFTYKRKKKSPNGQKGEFMFHL